MGRYEFHVFRSGIMRPKWYFNFESTNGETLFQSEGYSRRIDAERAIATIKREAATATLVIDDAG